MTRTTFALAASLIVSSFAMEAAAGNYHHKNTKHYNHSQKHANKAHYDKQGRYYYDASNAQGCISPVTLNNKELQKLRVKNPSKEICYDSVN